LKKYRTVIFVHGCFWHGHESCRYFTTPKTRTDWWLNKISINKKRDAESFERLKKMGWNIVLIWECTLKTDNVKEFLSTLMKEVSKQKKNQ
jgi:DNA mismatch endonuclease (patch repair protein)